MANINEILARAAALRDETALNSISPERAGSIMYDTLIALNELWLQQGAALVISKIYASVDAMEADTAPVSDISGKPLRPGQIVVIASSDSDNGSVYRYNGTDSPSWSLVGEIGNLDPVDNLESDSTSLPLAAHQGKVLDGKISQLGQGVAYTFNLVELTQEDYTKDENRKVNYSDGYSGAASASDNQDLYVIDIPAAKYNHIRVYMSKSISWYAAIALYSGNNEHTDYLKNDSLNGNVSAGAYYDLDLPDNAVKIKITNCRANVATPTISFFEPLCEKRSDASANYSRIDSQLTDVDEELKTLIVDKSVLELSSLVNGSDIYPLYSNGAVANAAAGSTFKTWLVPYSAFKDYKAILFKGGATDSVPAAIAFYNLAESSTIGNLGKDYYIKDYSKALSNVTKDILALIPSDAKSILLCSRTGVFNPDSALLTNTPFVYQEDYQKAEGRLDNILPTIDNPFIREPYYYHFQPNYFILDADSKKCVPSQSIADVEIAARLGFRFIEANIQATSDGHFICMHGVDRKFGSDEVEAADGVTDISNTLIASVTLAWIKQNVVFKSEVEKYRTAPASLEEFCEACKANSIGLFAGTFNEDAIKLCIKYMGTNLILYNPPVSVRDYFGGWIYTWNNEEKSIAELLERGDSYGYPYICGVGNTQVDYLLNNDLLDDFIDEFHKRNYLVVGAAVYSTESLTRELFRRGFDGSGAGHEINPFSHNYEIYDLEDGDFSDNLSGGASISNGICTLPEGETITCSEQVNRVPLGKAQVSIRFNGSLRLRFGSATTRNITSDGSELIIISDYFYHRDPGIVVTGVSASTIISEFVYKISKC